MPKTTIERLRQALRYDAISGKLYRNEYVEKSKFKIGDQIGTKNFEGYLTLSIEQEKLFAHRVAWALHFGQWPAQSIDHINMDKTDNRICNLRLALPVQNRMNTKPRGVSGLKGVTPLPNGKWQAQIKAEGRCQYLGSFSSPEEAAQAWNGMASKHHGQFAVLNHIGGAA